MVSLKVKPTTYIQSKRKRQLVITNLKSDRGMKLWFRTLISLLLSLALARSLSITSRPVVISGRGRGW